MKYSIDSSATHCNIAIGICHDCNSRFIAQNAADARERLAKHERAVHPASKSARESARKKRVK